MADWTATIRGLTIGDGTLYPFLHPGITGLGIPEMRVADTPRGHLSGHVGGDDVLEKRILTIPTGVDADTPGQALTLLTALKAAWAPSYIDIDFVLTLENVAITYRGRPRGFDQDSTHLGKGWVSVLLTFEALNPFAIGEAVDAAVPSP